MPHDSQEVHAQVPHVHAPLAQGLGGVRVQEHARQPRGCPLLVQGGNAPAEFRDGLKGESRAEWVALI